MDFGLDKIVERIETFFGERVAKGFVLVIMLAAVSVSLSLIWDHVIKPLLDAITGMKLTVSQEGIARAGWTAFSVAGGLYLGAAVFNFIGRLWLLNLIRRARQARITVRKGLRRVERMMEELKKDREEVISHMETANAMTEKASAALAQVLSTGEEMMEIRQDLMRRHEGS